ncbi:60S ribosomal L37A [Tubulinosema ratisbonensis]|uniref:60S ribosomal L37A n=1 Tax=Tubulinosema ratisbonensis TaxID=291195 RepID=A0A437AM07_9MICR|nr:60S ribosomal L37A [Tubulinosema ratisbonensis]
MSRRTKKVGIVGKYGVRYGSSLRKRIKTIEVSQHSTYECKACGKTAVKRKVVGIWSCKACRFTFAGGAFAPNTPAGLHSLAQVKEEKK